ncbi:MAG: hypothetical protein EOO52_11860 [Gammaproteobacteria bacterium]|nr:MAG: hypothetical protein EOO52_11860 [Gammaproteobacteria bacterium]
MSAKNCFLIAVFVLLQACGGGSKSPSTGGTSSVSSSHSSFLSASSNVPNSQSSISSWGTYSSMPADFPTGTVEALPVLDLNTEGAAAITSRETYINGNFTLTNAGVTDASGSLEVRGRGNSTWDWPKKPYRLKLTTSTSLLGMPKGKNWVLLANYADKTMVRNDVAFMFGRTLGFEWTPRAHYVELKLNGAYQGVYQLVEHIRIDKDRVNIDELKVADIDSDKISGGYLMEIDFRHGLKYCETNSYDPVCQNGINTSRNVDFCIDSSRGMAPACLANPETLHDPLWVNQRNYIETFYAEAEAALFGDNFKDPALGYAAYFDVDSVVNYYIQNELFRNVDGASASFYMFKKRGGKLFFGPIWDFDLSMGNAGYNNASNITGVVDWVFHGTHGGTGSYQAEVNELLLWQRQRAYWMDAQLSL